MSPRAKSKWTRLVFVALSCVLGVVFLWQTGEFARQFALQKIKDRSTHTLNLVVENLRGELAKYRYLPRLLTTNPTLSEALAGAASEADIKALNLELERINIISGALDTYLMDRSGLTVASSNWSSDRPFVGRNFSYRPYFQTAMAGQLGRFFALGTTSRERGYYFAYPVREQDTVIGAIVVKVEVGLLEASWRSPDHEIIVADMDGVVFMSSRPDWRFRALAPLGDEALARIRETRRYTEKDLRPLGIVTRADSDGLGERFVLRADTSGPERGKAVAVGGETEFLVQAADMKEADWRVLILARTDDVAGQVWTAVAVAGFMLVSLLLGAANLYQRRRRLAERIALQEKAKAQLEERVRERTDELSTANLQLRSEVAERRRAEAELRRTQADLVQASKLAALGQMSAGLSHELNQPLGAIRSYADNARAYLDRDDAEQAKSNLLDISGLIDRMARIIKHLRTYSRKETIEVRPTSVAAAVREALTLLRRRIAEDQISVTTDMPEGDVQIVGGDVRLQQVLVNLITNAIDAVAGSDDRRIEIRVTEEADTVNVTIRDSGTGIAEEDLPNVFDPFFTSKEVGKGLGLGLSITYGIVKQFQGTISAANHPDGGAVFTLTLVRASETTGQAA